MNWGTILMSKSSHHAYNKFPEMETVMRLQAVKRWHMIETTRIQTLAEHTANVALLAWVIALTSPGAFFQASSAASIALVHDTPEAFTGDIPSHTKRSLPPRLLDELERAVTPAIFFIPSMGPTSREALLVKLCDLADGIRFIRLHGVDVTARHAQTGLEEQLAAKWSEISGWPEVVITHVTERVNFYAYEES